MAQDFDVATEDADDAEAAEARARDYFADDRLLPALNEINRAVELDPKSFDAWSLRAKILVAMENPQDGLASIDRALEIVPGDYDALAEKSGILSMYGGDLDGGLKFAQMAYDAMVAAVTPEQRSNPDGDDFYAVENVYDNLYYVLYKSGKTDEAEKIRAEAGSFGHVFEAGVDDGEPPHPQT
jgi:tetratricopeptide (TPR) repeat protein